MKMMKRTGRDTKMKLAEKWLAVFCIAAAAAVFVFTGARTAYADTHIITDVSLKCDINSLKLTPASTENAVRGRLWSALATDTEGISVDTSDSTLMYWNETWDQIYGIGDGSFLVDEGRQYYLSYTLDAKDGYDWPDAVKGFKTEDTIPVAEVPEIRVYFNGVRCTEALLGFNSNNTWNKLKVRIPVFNDISSASVVLNASAFTYDGSVKTPAVKSATLANGTALKASNYTVRYFNIDNKEVQPSAAGKYYAGVEGKGIYGGMAKAAITIAPASIAGADIVGTSSVNYYTGKAITPKMAVTMGGKALKNGTDYVASYKNNVNVGKATVTITGKGNYTGTRTATFDIIKTDNPMKVSAKTVSLKKSKLKKKTQKISRAKAIVITGAQGKVTYKLLSVKKKSYKKYFSVNKKSGKITVKKGLKKGTYKLKIKVTAAGTNNYNRAEKSVTVKVKVK